MTFTQEIKIALQSYQRRILNRPQRAAVLMPIIEDEQGARILLTRRSSHLGSHAGEVSFPGGKVEDADQNLIATALRETYEEINVKHQDIEVLGVLDDMMPKKQSMAVTPVVGVIHNMNMLQANPQEVDRIFTIPIDTLIQSHRWRCKYHTWGNQSWPIYYFDYDGELLWGLSAYMTLIMLRLSRYGSPMDLSWLNQHFKMSH